MSSDAKNPLIGIIIPVYNTEDYLEECLNSVLNQTLERIEIICIDDNSSDNSPKILEKYGKKDNRVKILYNKKNTGQGVARNKALNEANGEYIYLS